MATFAPRLLELRNATRLRYDSIPTEEVHVDCARRTLARRPGMLAERKALARWIDALRELMQPAEPARRRPIGFVAPAPD